MKQKNFSPDELIDRLRDGSLSRRKFNQYLGAAGISFVMTPMFLGKAMASPEEQATFFTWGGWDLPELFPEYTEKHGEPPNFAAYGSSEEGFTKMRAGFTCDVAHPYNAEIPRWVESGLFQPIDTSKLKNWDDVIPALIDLPGNDIANNSIYFAPFDWGQTSITYRTDLVDFEGGEESWSVLWDERYKGKIAMLGGAGDAWWCAAIYAGVGFSEIGSKEGLDKVAALLRQQRPLVRTYAYDPTTINQALASGEVVAAMTWNDSAVSLLSEEVPVKFARPKEGALTWVGGVMIHRDAPHLDKAHDIVNEMLSYERGRYEISEDGYGHSNAKALASFTEEELQALGLSLDVDRILTEGHFMVPQDQAFETASNTLYEEIKAGF